MKRLATLAALAVLLSGQSTLHQGPLYLVDPPESLENIGAFGALKVTQERPLINLQFQYNINTEKVTTTVANGGTVTQANSAALLSTSTASNGSATLTSKYAARYVPGQGVTMRWTSRFLSGCVAGSLQYSGLGNSTDGLFFGCSGNSFGILYRRGGVDTFIPSTAWDVPHTTLDPTKGNVFQVTYQWLGYGAIKFYHEHPSGTLHLTHTIKYSNANTVVSLTNPTMGFKAQVQNQGNTTNLQLEVPSVGMYAEGPRTRDDGLGAAYNRKTGVSATTLTNILTVRNNSTFAGVANTTNLRIDHVAVACNSDCSLRIIRNATLAGSPSYVDFDATTSVAAVDTAGTTVTGGRFIGGTVTDTGDDSLQFDRVEIRIGPGETITFAALSVTGSANIAVHASWSEEF